MQGHVAIDKEYTEYTEEVSLCLNWHTYLKGWDEFLRVLILIIPKQNYDIDLPTVRHNDSHKFC